MRQKTFSGDGDGGGGEAGFDSSLFSQCVFFFHGTDDTRFAWLMCVCVCERVC